MTVVIFEESCQGGILLCFHGYRRVSICVLSALISVFRDPHPGALTFLGHADLKALLQPAVLAAVACDLVNLAILVSVAGVHHVLLDTAAEEALKRREEKGKGGKGKRGREIVH